MTIASAQQKIIYAGNGSTTIFAIPFSFNSEPSLIEVWLRDETDPTAVTEAQKLSGPDYTIVGTNVVMVVAPAADEELLIRRIHPLTQLFDYILGGVFPQEAHELNLDRLCMMVQQISESASRSLKFSNTSGLSGDNFLSEDPVTDSVLVWSANGIVNGPNVSTIEAAVAAAAAAAVSAASAAASAATATAAATAAALSAAAAAVSEAAAAVSAASAAAAAGLIGTPFQEVLAGVVNGVNTVFTVTTAPSTAEAFELFKDGILLQETEYTVVGTTITVVVPPALGQSLYGVFTVATVAISADAFQEIPAGAINNANTIFTLSTAPLLPSAFSLYQDGLLLTPVTDYSLAGSTITMVVAPNFFQSLYAIYTGSVTGIPFSGSNTGDVTLAAVGAAPNANAASLAGQVLNLQPASAAFPGVVTTGAQTIAGAKTFSGAISASNLSGTNTGDQTITLTDDVTGSGTGSFAATVANDAITNAKAANMPASTIKGNDTGAPADPKDLTVAEAKVLLNLAGTNTGDQTITLTSDATGSGVGSFAATIAADAVTNAKAANMAQSTIKGRAVGAGTGDPTDLTSAQATAILDAFTSALQGLAPASGGGTANFLRADGTWALPTVAGFDLATESLERDEFLNNSDTDELGSQGWRVTNNGTGTAPATISGLSKRPGLIRISSGTSATSRSAIHLGDGALNPHLGVDGLTFQTSLRISATTLFSRLVAGLGDINNSVADHTNGVYFSFDKVIGDINWFLVTANAGVRTRADTGIPVVANQFYNLKYVGNAAGTSIQAFIDGVSVGAAIVTNIPTVALQWIYKVDGIVAGTNADVDIDYWFYRQTGLTR